MAETTTAQVKDFIKGDNMMPKSSGKKKVTPYVLGYRKGYKKGYDKGFEEGREYATKLLVDLHINTVREQRGQNNTQQTVRKEKTEA